MITTQMLKMIPTTEDGDQDDVGNESADGDGNDGDIVADEDGSGQAVNPTSNNNKKNPMVNPKMLDTGSRTNSLGFPIHYL